MSKKLIVIMVLAFVVGISAAAFAEVQNVKIGGDITAVGLSRQNLNLKGSTNNLATSADNEFASISRIKIDANLTDNVDVTFRLLNERVWGGADRTGSSGISSNYNDGEVDVDLAYITLKEFMKSSISVPLNLVIGRQNIKIGSGLLVGAAGTNQSNTTQLPVGAGDLSARSAFDGIVGVWDFTPEFTVISAYVKANEGSVIAGKDTDVYVADATFKLGDNSMKTVLEGTYVLSRKVKNNVNNFGGRVTLEPVQNLNVEGEYVYQVSNVEHLPAAGPDYPKHVADAIRLGANFGLPDVLWNPSVGVDYMRLGKDWNKMHESLSPADLANLIFPNQNLTVYGVTVSAKPMNDLMLKLRYASLNLTKKYSGGADLDDTTITGASYSIEEKKPLGYEVDLGLAYDYTSDVQFGLNYGLLKPGKAFDITNRKSASQVIGSMKVSF
jgi:hypothetical protein